MTNRFIHDFLRYYAATTPGAPALHYKDETWDYAALARLMDRFAAALTELGSVRNDRIAVFLPKQCETVVAMVGAGAAGGVFVPINPTLKPAQVAYILQDCNVRILVTSGDRLGALADALADCPDLESVICVGDRDAPAVSGARVHRWSDLLPEAGATGADDAPDKTNSQMDSGQIDSVQIDSVQIDSDMAAIMYTSGSTGAPKGVVLSHLNIVAGAHSVADYLSLTASDRLLAVLPFSFDYGMNQLTTAFTRGASVALMDYLLPRDVLKALVRYQITGLAAVPPLWNQLVTLQWPEEIATTLRYVTNSGGAMPVATTNALRELLPSTRIFLMYGLTEAFRSTFLDPAQVAVRPTSMGKAIPNAEVMIVRADGTLCDVDEPGELVHRGVHVALGYWNDPERTAERFKPAPGQPSGLTMPEIAVFSGDQVKRDADGYLYFVSRLDDMIKTSGYRVSPSEVEEVIFDSKTVSEAIAFGVPHPQIGYAIVAVAVPGEQGATDATLAYLRKNLPNFMIPRHFEWRESLPRNPNGKVDRKSLRAEFESLFTTEENARAAR